MAPRLFALDQGFPQPIVHALHNYLEQDVSLVPLADIDARLPDMHNDWEILLSLHHHERRWDGLVSTDTGMLNGPRELATLMQSKLTLVVCKAVGHDPVRATGLLLTNIGMICTQTHPEIAQLWKLEGGARRSHENPWDHFSRVADKRGLTAGELREAEWLTQVELDRNPLDL